VAFQGQRLKMARLYRNMTASELADIINISKQSISQFENDISKPKLETEFHIVRGLNFPREFFHCEIADAKVSNTFFRALSSTTSIDKKTQEVKTQVIVQIYNFLCEYLDMPQLDFVDLNFENEDIENIALQLREYWGLGEAPVPNMVNLIENHGIITSAFDVESDKIDAFTQVHMTKQGPQYCVVVGNNKKSAVRRNFDIAHELGHIILHNNIGNIDELSAEQFRKMEDEANEFAAAFLLPKNSFYNDLHKPWDLSYYIELKRKWHVSIGAMLIRAKNLNRITNNEYQSLMKSMAYRKWRTHEPLDDEFKVSPPTLFTSAIEILLENHIMSPHSFVSKLATYGVPMYANELEDLLALPENTLYVEPRNTKILKPIINVKEN